MQVPKQVTSGGVQHDLQREIRVVLMWTGIEVSAFAFCNLLSASLAPVIVLPALGRAVKGRLEG